MNHQIPRLSVQFNTRRQNECTVGSSADMASSGRDESSNPGTLIASGAVNQDGSEIEVSALLCVPLLQILLSRERDGQSRECAEPASDTAKGNRMPGS